VQYFKLALVISLAFAAALAASYHVSIDVREVAQDGLEASYVPSLPLSFDAQATLMLFGIGLCTAYSSFALFCPSRILVRHLKDKESVAAFRVRWAILCVMSGFVTVTLLSDAFFGG
jgi:hypothetical protein